VGPPGFLSPDSSGTLELAGGVQGHPRKTVSARDTGRLLWLGDCQASAFQGPLDGLRRVAQYEVPTVLSHPLR
jgi:hypothetical protein